MIRQRRIKAVLTVLVAPAAEGGFYAQGVELDYVATGATEEEAKDRFAHGLVATLQEFIRRDRSIAGLFKSDAPAEARKAFFASDRQPVLFCEVIGKEDIPYGHHVPRTLQFVRAHNTLPA